MTNEITTLDNFGAVPDVFKDSPVDISRFTAGIQPSWPFLSINGKTFGVRYRGETTQFTAPNPAAGGAQMPVQFLDVVIIDAGSRISKVFYKKGYVLGDRSPPDCWSADGITPDPGASDKQANTCRGCMHNVFGSSIGPAGQRGKACSDNKRVAIAIADDISNKIGPIMFRLPPGSFSNYATFIAFMAAKGFAPFTFLTRLTFDPQVPHPKVVFTAVRTVTREEGLQIVEVQKNPLLPDMLNDKALGALLDPEVADEGVGAATLPPAGAGGPAPGSAWAKPVTPPSNVIHMPGPTSQPPKLTPEQQRIVALEAALVAAVEANKHPEPEPEPEPVLTPEQLRIRDLEAKLAEAQAQAKAVKPRKPRSTPVSPTPTQGATQEVTQPGNETQSTPVGNAIADRVAQLARGKNLIQQ